MYEFLKTLMDKTIDEVIAIAKEMELEFDYKEETTDEYASIDFKLSKHKAYVVFNEQGIADDWDYYSI